MELKHLLSDINDLRIHKSNNNLSEWGEDKLKEYEFILTELAELKKLRVTDVISSPIELEPVLAEIEHINELGLSKWYEVVYFDVNWQCYAGSKTFKDGEKVIKWKYCKDCL